MKLKIFFITKPIITFWPRSWLNEVVKKKSDFIRVFYLARPFWGKIFGISLLILVMSGVNQFYPLITRSLIDTISTGKTTSPVRLISIISKENPSFSVVILYLKLSFVSSVC